VRCAFARLVYVCGWKWWLTSSTVVELDGDVKEVLSIGT